MIAPVLTSDQLLAELDDSLPQGQPNATRYEDDLSELDALLEESVEADQERQQYQVDLKARKRGFHGMSQEEVQFCNSRMAAFEAQRVWQTTHAISVWAHYTCTRCDSMRQVFSRFMEHQQSRQVKSTHRWVTVGATLLEATPVKETRFTPECARCSEWDLDPRAMVELKEVLE